MKTAAFLSALLMFLLSLYGCASSNPSPYETRFNQQLQWGMSKRFVTGKSFSEVSAKVTSELYAMGYGHPIYENPLFGFVVVNKNSVYSSGPAAAADIPQIMIKFTQWQTGQTRVDFVNGQSTLAAARTAERDVAVLIEALKTKGFGESKKNSAAEKTNP